MFIFDNVYNGYVGFASYLFSNGRKIIKKVSNLSQGEMQQSRLRKIFKSEFYLVRKIYQERSFFFKFYLLTMRNCFHSLFYQDDQHHPRCETANKLDIYIQTDLSARICHHINVKSDNFTESRSSGGMPECKGLAVVPCRCMYNSHVR